MIRPVTSNVLSSVISNVIRGAAGFPSGDFDPISSTYYKEPIGGSDATERYLTATDGQDDFFSRGAQWVSSGSDHTIEFTASVSMMDRDKALANPQNLSSSGEVLIYFDSPDGLQFIFIDSGGGLNRHIIGRTDLDDGDTHHFKFNTTGTTLTVTVDNSIELSTVDSEITGVNFKYKDFMGGDGRFNDGKCQAIKITDPASLANSDTYKLTGNGDFEDALGKVGDLIARLTFENGEPSGSDRELITRRPDNSGWVGTSTDYDYAAGAND